MAVSALFENPAVAKVLPAAVRQNVERWADHVNVLLAVRNPAVIQQMAPSAVRGLFLRQGRRDEPTRMRASHEAHFDWSYKSDFPELQALYQKAKRMQWNAATDIDWKQNVEPLSPENPLLPHDFLAWDHLRGLGVRLTPGEEQKYLYLALSWMLSQFLHGEQGALLASAQVTESVPFTDGKFYGATQVMDEARHIEVFHRYLETKLNKRYQVNDNLFTIIDSLMHDGRWDMKFLGMQIMVEGLALGAFSMLYKVTREPLLRQALRRVIHDEARHVNYGVLALRDLYTRQLSERERIEREDWAFEVAVLMRDRFLVHELYEEEFEGQISRRQWNAFIDVCPGMSMFRTTMFSRLVPNLRELGLLTDRVLPHYERVGLGRFMHGRSTLGMEGDDYVDDRAA
jgi:hypothetical protein